MSTLVKALLHFLLWMIIGAACAAIITAANGCALEEAHHESASQQLADEWYTPRSYPVPVAVGRDLSDCQKFHLALGVEQWNRAAGFELFVRVGGYEVHTPGAINVTAELPPPEASAAYDRFHEYGLVMAGPTCWGVDTWAHELGHALWLNHDDEDPTSIMYGAWTGLRQVQPRHIEHVRRLMGLNEGGE